MMSPNGDGGRLGVWLTWPNIRRPKWFGTQTLKYGEWEIIRVYWIGVVCIAIRHSVRQPPSECVP
jgi:hypothetical protein